MMSTFEGRITNWSGAAILFQGQFWESGVWLPRSQVVVDEDEDGVVVRVKDWLAKKNGLLEFTHYTKEELEAMNG